MSTPTSSPLSDDEVADLAALVHALRAHIDMR